MVRFSRRIFRRAAQGKRRTGSRRHLRGRGLPQASPGRRDVMTFIYWSFTDKLTKTDTEGRNVKTTEAPNHSGDLCCVGGVLYVATNLGKFNTEDKADSWVYAYRSDDLSLLNTWKVPELPPRRGRHHVARRAFLRRRRASERPRAQLRSRIYARFQVRDAARARNRLHGSRHSDGSL